MAKTRMVPPEGGWGWAIVFAYAICNLVLIPIMQTFGLVFKDTFAQMGFSATDGSFIITSNAAFAMLMGLINGPLLRRYSYRKVSIWGGIIMSSGLVLTAFANNFTELFITYGLITSIGMGMGVSSYSLAISTYFIKKRNKATGIASAITGMGPIIIPQLISFLMTIYDVKGVVLILAAIATHSIFSALLLQPVKWHMIEEIIDEENGVDENQQTLLNEDLMQRKRSVNDANHRWSSSHSLENSNNKHAYEEIEPINNNGDNAERKCSIYNTELSVSVTKENPNTATCWSRVFRYIVELFDLHLLKDPKYVNIMVGMSLAVFAELNFSLLTPFILADMGLTTSRIATFLSLLSGTDVIFRFLSPFIGDFFQQPPRIMYMISLFMLILTRYTLLFFTTYTQLIFVALGLGVAKGVRTVYWTLVIPAYVPLERLAAASGLQMMVNGIFIFIGGPLLGVIRDFTGSYYKCILVMNMITLTTILMWSAEMVYERVQSRRKAQPVQEN